MYWETLQQLPLLFRFAEGDYLASVDEDPSKKINYLELMELCGMSRKFEKSDGYLAKLNFWKPTRDERIIACYYQTYALLMTGKTADAAESELRSMAEVPFKIEWHFDQFNRTMDNSAVDGKIRNRMLAS